MNDASPSTFSAVRRLSAFLFLAILFFSTRIIQKYPTHILVAAVILILIGASAFIYGVIELKRHNPVYDYKPMLLWGKNTNGKHIRDVFTTFIALGMWTSLTSLVIALLSINNLLSK